MRRDRHHGGDVLVFHHARPVLFVQTPYLAHGADEALDVSLPVADGEIGEDVAEVAEFYLNVVFVAEDVVDFDARKPHVEGVDGEFCAVEVEDAVSVDEFFAVGVPAADVVDLFAGVICKFDDLRERLLSAQREVAAGDVEGGEQQVARARRLGEVDDLAHMVAVYAAAREQKGALRQAAARFVHGHGRHVCTRRHRGDGQPFAEIEVRAVRLVGDDEHIVLVRQLYDGAEIRTDAVIGGVVYEDRLRVGGAFDGAFELLQAHAEGDAEAGVRFGIDVDGDGAAQHERAHHAAVHVAGEDDLFSRLHDGHDHALHGGGGAAHHQEGAFRPEGVGGELLRVAYDGDGVAEVVERLHGVHVHAHALFA